MCSGDFENYLRKNRIAVPNSEQNRKVIIISDSKGFFFERLHKETEIEKILFLKVFRAGPHIKQHN